ncbi:MAG: hypothetical protein ACRD3W_25465, partial [Terriglobales bacterium]
YTLARDPHQVSVLDVIRASERATRDGIHGKHLARFGVPTWLPSTTHGQPNRRGCAAPGYDRGHQGTSLQPH